VVDLGRPWDVLATSRYVVARQVAATMRSGRVLLAGDAAHQNSPLGGMGMNSGIQDAVSLGRRLGFEVKRTTAPAITPSMRSALRDLKLDALMVVHAGADSFPLSTQVRAVSAGSLLEEILPLR